LTAWYALHPHSPQLSIFNPATGDAHVDVRFIGSSTVKGEQLRLAAHQSYRLSTHSATAVVMSASDGVAVGYVGAPRVATPLAPQPSTQAAVTAAGRLTRVTLFNPSAQPAHVTVSMVNHTTVTQRTVLVAPSHVYSVPARTAVGPPRGVVVNSDVPLVAAPTS
jgi:hypothetical protein